ncbi:MAG: hypothetical protein IPG89_21255 [Bacteroidetes bacterium]|nr:hypothetical protein [Bacteroidota bacterium]
MDRPKMGFAIPIENWMRNELKDKIHYYLDVKNRTTRHTKCGNGK